MIKKILVTKKKLMVTEKNKIQNKCLKLLEKYFFNLLATLNNLIFLSLSSKKEDDLRLIKIRAKRYKIVINIIHNVKKYFFLYKIKPKIVATISICESSAKILSIKITATILDLETSSFFNKKYLEISDPIEPGNI